MQDLAKQTGMVVVAPMYEEDEKASGIYYNTAAVIDADGTYLGKYRKTHIPHVKGFWEKFYFRPGNLGYPVFETAVGKIGVYICYDRHFPEGARALGLNGAEIVLIPSATSRGLSEYLWRIEQVSHAVANGYFVGTINRVGIERTSATTTSTARATSSTRAASSSATWAPPTTRSSSSATSTSTRSPRSATPGSSTATVGPTRTTTSPDPSPSRRLGCPEEDSRAASDRTREEPMQFGFTLKPEHTIERTLALTRQARPPASTTAGCSTGTSCGANRTPC